MLAGALPGCHGEQGWGRPILEPQWPSLGALGWPPPTGMGNCDGRAWAQADTQACDMHPVGGSSKGKWPVALPSQVALGSLWDGKGGGDTEGGEVYLAVSRII